MKVAIALMVSLVLVLSVVVMIDNQRVYAQQASATVTLKQVFGATGNRDCTAITEDSDGNIWQACTTGSSRFILLVDSAGATLDSLTVSGSDVDGWRLFYDGTVDGFEAVLNYRHSNHALVGYVYNTTSGDIEQYGSFVPSSCSPVGTDHVNKVGQNFYFACNGATNQVRLVTNTMVQIGQFDGMKTGSPTCTALNAIWMYSGIRGVAVCDDTTLIQFGLGLSSSTIVKGDSITVSTSMASGRAIFANNQIWVNVGGDLRAVPFDTSSNTFTDGDSSDILVIDGGISDIIVGQGSSAGFIHAVDPDSNAYYMINPGAVNPVEALSYVALSSFDFASNAKLSSMTDNISYMFSKGATSTQDFHYFTITDIVSGASGGIGDFVTDASSCSSGSVPVRLSTGLHCVVPASDGTIDISTVNPLYGGDNTLGVSGLPVALATLLNVDEESAKIMSAAGAVLFLMSFIMIPAWKFGHSPPFFVWFIVIMFGVAISTVLGWIEPLYFAVMVVIAALGAGLKWSGAL